MKKLLFALTPAQNIANGSSIYTYLIFKKAIATGKPFEAYYNPDIKENQSIIEDIPRHVPLHKCLNTNDLEHLLESGHFDTVFFGSEMDTGARLPEDVTPIVVIHDLRFIEIPNDKTRYLYRKTPFDRLKQIVISKLSPDHDSISQKRRISRFIDNPRLKIVTVSNHTKYSILLNYPQIKDSQIHVLTSPNPEIHIHGEINDCEAFSKLNLGPGEYFLVISAGRWFKNSYRAIWALDHIADRNLLKGKKILVLGVQKGSKIVRVKHPENFIFMNYVEPETLQCAFKNAYCFIYPSLQEGFGTPPLEAMQYGTPVLAASTTAINEVCRTGAYYFNPYSVMEIENRILHLLSDQTFYEHQSGQGIERCKEIISDQKKDLDELMKLIFE